MHKRDDVEDPLLVLDQPADVDEIEASSRTKRPLLDNVIAPDGRDVDDTGSGAEGGIERRDRVEDMPRDAYGRVPVAAEPVRALVIMRLVRLEPSDDANMIGQRRRDGVRKIIEGREKDAWRLPLEV